MKKVERVEKEERINRVTESFYTYLPEGCKICGEGGKLILFLTGECVHSCFYCPISEERKDKDIIFANERPVRSYEDLIKEIELMDAEGASITGGEPLTKPTRVLEYLKLLKDFDLHIHLYTSIPISWEMIDRFSAYLDEIRFHPVGLENPERFANPIEYSRELGMDAGFEIPALYFRADIAELTNRLDCFLNLNELEFSQTNYENLVERGYEVDDFYGAIGSREIAERYASIVKKFHYCTARFKDSVQLRRRLLRMAYNHPDFYTVTEDGTIMCGLIEGEREKIQKAIDFLNMVGEDYRLIEGTDTSGDSDTSNSETWYTSIETSVEVVKRWKDRFKRESLNVSIIERYPTYKRIVVEVEPL